MKPIPWNLLRQSVTLKVPTSKDGWGTPGAYTDYSLTHVNMQQTSQTKKTVDNTLVTYNALMFYDCARSSPTVDIISLKKSAEPYGDLLVVFGGVTYTVQAVDALRDETGDIHHYELMLL